MRLVFSLIIISFFFVAQAQHCPYDGLYLVAIKVVDGKEKMLRTNTVFYLQEVDNDMADSCMHTKGKIKKQFVNSNKFIAAFNIEFSHNGYGDKLHKRLNDAGVFKNANMMLSLNQVENTCMLIGKSETVYTNYIYRQRKFYIVYTIDGKEYRKKLPANFIYSLCTATDDLKHFKTITIKL